MPTSTHKCEEVGVYREFHAPCAGGIEYVHSSTVSRKKRQKGNPVPGGTLGWDSKVWLWVLSDLDQR
jgi:hypothetical protein